MASVDPGRIALTGATIGATPVAYVLGAQPGLRLRGGVGLSAVESPGLIDLASKRRFKPHDLLLIADDREMLNVDNIANHAEARASRSSRRRSLDTGSNCCPTAACASS